MSSSLFQSFVGSMVSVSQIGDTREHMTSHDAFRTQNGNTVPLQEVEEDLGTERDTSNTFKRSVQNPYIAQKISQEFDRVVQEEANKRYAPTKFQIY